MSSAARIEELQKKFDENPRRYFAPLANECRKAGDLDAAIAICRTHLPQQPGHMSGHIVYGQALFESGDLAEAQTVFETALGLDPENLIALRHMGDIAARHGDLTGARQWYDRVLETDPRNEEIQALVAGLGQGPVHAADVEDAATYAPEPTQAEPAFADQAPEPEDMPRVRGGLPTLVDPALLAAAADAIPDGDVATPPAGEDWPASDALDFGDPEPVPAPLVTSEFEAAAAADTPRDELLEPTALEFEAPVDAGTMEGLEATTFEAPSADEVSSYERVGDEALLDGIEARAPQLEGLETAEFDASGYGGSGLEPIAGPSFEFEPADAGPLQDPPTVDPAPPPPEAFVTETMAELYLRQGYRDEALGVYRKLVSQSPHDGALRSRMERLEAELSDDAATEVATSAEPIDAEGDDIIAGLPRTIDPALVAAAAEAGQGDSEAGEPEAGAGPTIREYLAALATAAAVPATAGAGDAVEATPASGGWPTVDDVSEWPADDAADTAAEWPEPDAPIEAGEVAEVVDLGDFDLADPGANAQPLVAPAAPGGLDALFGEPDESDVAAADTLAAAFRPDAAYDEDRSAAAVEAELPPAAAAGEPSEAEARASDAPGDSGQPEPDPLRGRPARPAGSDLSLDHVFGGPRQQGSPRNTGGFSFDQFFSEGAAKPAREEAPEPPAATGDEEDLEQFNSWLHNLRKQ